MYGKKCAALTMLGLFSVIFKSHMGDLFASSRSFLSFYWLCLGLGILGGHFSSCCFYFIFFSLIIRHWMGMLILSCFFLFLLIFTPSSKPIC